MSVTANNIKTVHNIWNRVWAVLTLFQYYCFYTVQHLHAFFFIVDLERLL